MNQKAHKREELTRSAVSRLLLRVSERRRLAPVAVRTALRLEKGQFYSYTAREIMKRRFGISIGPYSYGSCFDVGRFPAEVSIGRYVSLGPEMLVYRRNHPIDRLSTHPFFYNAHAHIVRNDTIISTPLAIEHDAWIGARVIVTPRCTRIGLGSVCGAGAVVTHDVPDFAIVAGCPARIVGTRFSEAIAQLVRDAAWWNHSIHELLPFVARFTTQLGTNGLTFPWQAAPGSDAALPSECKHANTVTTV